MIISGRLDRLPPLGQSTRPGGRMNQRYPIEYLGDIGAVILPCPFGCAFEAGRSDYAMGTETLVIASEDDGMGHAI